jgi:hypothetical protein
VLNKGVAYMPIVSAESAAGNLLRFYLGVSSIDLFDGFLQYSDLAGAKKILIWELQ